MKYKQKVETLTSLVLILIGTLLLLCPLYKITDIKWINLIIFLSYAIINLLKFILTYKSKDYEGLFTCLASIVAAITSIVLKSEKSAINLSLTLMIWIILLSLIKLKKADYRRFYKYEFRYGGREAYSDLKSRNGKGYYLLPVYWYNKIGVGRDYP